MPKKGRINIMEWCRGLAKIGAMSKERCENIISLNEQKDVSLKKYNLRISRNFGKASTINELSNNIPQEYKKNGLFWLRMIPQDEKGKLKSFFELSWKDVNRKAKKYSKNKQYIFELIEYYPAEYAGTIIFRNGKILQELWKGEHRSIDKKSSKDIKIQYIDIMSGALRFGYSKNTTIKEKDIMMLAIQRFSPIDRESLKKLRVYADYAYTRKKGFLFLDASEDEFWIGR